MALTRYLLWCVNDLVGFRVPELRSVAAMLGIQLRFQDPEETEHPYLLVDLEDDESARKILSRTLLVRSCFRLYAAGQSMAEIHRQIRSLIAQDFLSAYREASFRIQVEGFSKTISFQEKLDRVNAFAYLPLKGPVKLKDPDLSLHLFEYYGLDPNRAPEEPYRIFFGRWVCDGQRKQTSKYSLKDRKFIGSTSMDPCLALIMGNLAQVKPGDIVLDPFVGTGSLLIGSGHWGAYVLGTDIDYLTLHGKTKPTRYNQEFRAPDESVEANMKQYGLWNRYLDVVVSDAALPIWRRNLRLDAIVTDPPYGIREATEKIGSKRHKPRPVLGHQVKSHIPSRVQYGLGEIYKDLLRFAATHLEIGGRLVFWYPVNQDGYCEERLPSLSCLQLRANCEQVLSVHSSRRLMAYTKIKEPESSEEPFVDAELLAGFRDRFFGSAAKGTRQERKKTVNEKRQKRLHELHAQLSSASEEGS
ncbi:unnamed protein product [Darwinula stevensoni]|uniref:tRNA (guanine(10)-N(2))-methyltransferase TRMT11 n=1 Tax=Darwinula stevensoni TaxID=69355 RepID=A0A7R9A144_9CRUS|nr:unnamed protein product [Darwinula stevensoni]CAG0882638.1 unnamed protein product [Darwinula stevensoni]